MVEHDTREPNYCVLVSSCDAYADCWPPFFELFALYWADRDIPIYLNTETVAFEFKPLDIRCPRVELTGERRLAWSDRLLRCLDTIPYETVLYAQEDYFLKDHVDLDAIQGLVRLMATDGIAHIGLERGLTATPGPPSRYPFLREIERRAEYRISAQAGLWQTTALRSYLRRHETVWEFEWYGTRRAWRRPDLFLHVGPEYEDAHGKNMFPYDPTGVVAGQWARDVVEDLFARHHIDVDYRRRGFHDPGAPRRRPPRVKRALRRARSLT
jgi:hypothetical protein